MLINGEKWACETCIKGHRATHCKHTDRQLVPIKKKGRPSTQCKRCRELRVVRQLHVKCDCEDQGDRLAKKKKENSNNVIGMKKKIKIDVLRPIAPKQDYSSNNNNNSYMASSSSPVTSSPPLHLSYLPSPVIATPSPPPAISPIPSSPVVAPVKEKSGCCGSKKNNNTTSNTPPLSHSPALLSTVTQPKVSCCSSKSTSASTTSNTPTTSAPSPSLPLEPVPLPNIPPPSSCCGPPSKNQQGEMIRVVTCRCGDSCACIGCDAHPSRAMKEGRDDVYIGFDDYSKSRRVSIASLTTPNTKPTLPKPMIQAGTDSAEHPSSILIQDGFVVCGCGCSKGFSECSDCLQELCNYL